MTAPAEHRPPEDHHPDEEHRPPEDHHPDEEHRPNDEDRPGEEDRPPEEHRPDERRKMTVSERSLGTLGATLEGWLSARLGHPEGLVVSGVRMPGSGGLSSTSVLFEADWAAGGTRQRGAYVARMAPEASAVPVFPSYDLAGQFEVISQVAARSDVPLPGLRWNEPDGGPLGTAGYGGDPDWSHGRWMGRQWSQASVYDLTEPAVAGRVPFGVIDHLARARFGGEEGWGLFEHASIGRHDPTGFADWSSVAPGRA